MFLLNKSFFFFGIWIISVGIELVLGTRVKLADVRRKTLLTAAGETYFAFNNKLMLLKISKCILHIKGRSICPWENDRYAKDIVFH